MIAGWRVVEAKLRRRRGSYVGAGLVILPKEYGRDPLRSSQPLLRSIPTVAIPVKVAHGPPDSGAADRVTHRHRRPEHGARLLPPWPRSARQSPVCASRRPEAIAFVKAS